MRSAEADEQDKAGEPVPGIEIRRVSRWLAAQVPELELPVRIEPIAVGRSNLTYGLTDGRGRRLVLRRPPLGTLQARAHDVGREWMILSALAGSAVPTPAPVAYCEDPAVTGAPFFVMEHVGGETMNDRAAGETLAAAARTRAGEAAVGTLARLHALDVDAVGLSVLRRPSGLVERQLKRWSRQLDSYPVLASELLRPVQRALERNVPPKRRSALVHGDYKLNNLRIDDHGEVVAVLDWELAAVGDPLVDLGWLIASWAQPGDERAWIVAPATAAGGFASPSALAAEYRACSRTDLTNLDYYIAFAYWRWSCINEGIRARFAAGAMGDRRIDPRRVEEQIRWQLEAAAALIV